MTFKPKKRDFKDMNEFLKASAAWAKEHMNEWPYGGPKDEDDDFVYVLKDKVNE